MKIDDIEKNTKDLRDRISKGEINDYTVNTFTTLCGKAIDHFSMLGDDKYKQYVEMMKTVLLVISIILLVIYAFMMVDTIILVGKSKGRRISGIREILIKRINAFIILTILIGTCVILRIVVFK